MLCMYVSPMYPSLNPTQPNQPNQPLTIIQSATDETLLGRILILTLKGRKKKKMQHVLTVSIPTGLMPGTR